MKTLLLMRHAKAELGEAGQTDHERALAPRGLKAARRIGRFLAASDLAPDLVLASTAVRARKTAELAHTGGGFTCPIRLLPDFYDSSPAAVLAGIAREAGPAERVLAVGHEPVWSELVAELTGGRVRMVTAAVAAVELHLDGWGELTRGARGLTFGRLVFVLPPRLLENLLDP